MTSNEILTKIEDALGYVEMGKKSPNERVNAILAEIDEARKSQPVEMPARASSGVNSNYSTKGERTMICTDGHQNEAGGCCCPTCGNTCGFHPEYDKSPAPAGYDTLAEYLNDQPDKETGPDEDDSLDALKEKYPHLPIS